MLASNGQLRNLVLLYLLNAVKDLGVSLPLIFRRTAQMASDDIDYLSKTFADGNIDKANFESIVRGIFEVMKNEGLVEDIKITNLDTSNVELEVKGCEYLPLVRESRRDANGECPLCLVALAGAIASATIKDSISFNDVETTTDTDNRLCKIRIRYVSND